MNSVYPNSEPPPQAAATATLGEAAALASVQRGVVAGYVLAAMNAFLAWYIYDTGYGVKEAAGDDRTIIAASTLFMAIVASALAYRLGRRHSIWIPIFLLSWIAFEVIAKFLNGKPATEYLVAVGLVGFGLISGLRGALALRKSRRTLETEKD